MRPRITTRAVQLLAGGHCSYLYFGKGRLPDLCAATVIACEMPSHHGGNMEMKVVFGNGRVQFVSGIAPHQVLQRAVEDGLATASE